MDPVASEWRGPLHGGIVYASTFGSRYAGLASAVPDRPTRRSHARWAHRVVC